MPIETKDLEPVLTGITEIKAEQGKNATAISEIKADVTTVKEDVTEAKKDAAELKAWQVKKDEADKKNQEALDNLIIANKKKPFGSAEKELKSLTEAIGEELSTEEVKSKITAIAENRKDREKKFSVEIKAVADMAVSTNYTGTAALTIVKPGYVMAPNRKTHIRSLVPTGTVGAGTSLVFGRENGAGEGAIAPAAEGATKSQFDLDLAEGTAGIETIAGWMRVTRKMMNNVPGFISYLQARLPEKLLNVEDAQLLQGSGVSPQLKGIMTSGNFTAASTSATVLVERLMDSIAQLEESDRSATGITLRPADWMSLFKNKAAGSGEYDAPSNVTFVNGVLYIAGVPIYATTALPSGKFIVGDFQMGAQLLTQEGMRIEFFEQDGTNVRENKITVRIEETISFPVFGNDFFIVGDVTGA